MYSDLFCKIYNEFGWNYFPEAFGEELLQWIQYNRLTVSSALDLGCGSGVLCEVLKANGIEPWGMDLSDGMISVAKERCGDIHYEVGNMITYRPEKTFDLVTCTGDAMNHILDLADVKRIFENVHSYLKEGGYFIFDILNEKEVPSSEPFDFTFDESVQAQFSVTREYGLIYLKTIVYENGTQTLEEVITETLHAPETICKLLTETGFSTVTCSDRLLPTSHPGTTWYIMAKK